MAQFIPKHQQHSQQPVHEDEPSHYAHPIVTTAQLLDLGANKFDLLLPETRILPHTLHPDEHVIGIVYGRYSWREETLYGHGALVATDRRVLLIDKKPLYVHFEEIIYEAVSGITYTSVGFKGYATIHSKSGTLRLRTFNRKCLKKFVEAVDTKLYATDHGSFEYT